VLRATFILAALGAALIAGCGGGSTKTSQIPAGGATTPTTTQASTTPAGCTNVQKPAPKPDGGRKKPSASLASGKTYKLTVVTNCGSFTMQLDTKSAPNASASMVALAKSGFFNGTVFHRIVPGFVIQGGDPTGTGTSGPGYTTVDVPPASTRYTLGVVAMAKSGAEPPGTAGSQFFVVTAQDAQLPPDYAVLGTIVKGQATVDKIGQFGDPASGGQGVPTETVEIEKATVTVH
jgi:peptidyl-prolyl cis-trans isomerase B (cyclophilin B)